MEKITRAHLQCILIEERGNAYSVWDGKFSEKEKLFEEIGADRKMILTCTAGRKLG
jgi:hypothetical protein